MSKFLGAVGREAGHAPGWALAARHIGALILGALAACSSPPPAPIRPAAPSRPSSTPPAAVEVEVPSIVRSRSRWIAVGWRDLPGWGGDRGAELWPALLRSCERPAAGWDRVCAEAKTAVLPGFSDDAALDWLEARLQPYRVQSLDGSADGLATGYFEPLVAASRQPTAAQRVPLYAPPSDLGSRQPYWTRRELETLPEAQAGLRGRALAYVADPLDALILQIQGSGRLELTEADGRRRLVRIAFAGHNGQPYQSVGRWLLDRGELPPGQASWPAIKAWARAHPGRIDELIWANPRTVFFREEPLPDPQLGPRGAQGVPLTPGRSVAVDPASVPFGTPVWLDSTEPRTGGPLRRLVMAQDTGTAITGAVRVDYFCGWGADAEAMAGSMKQGLRMWALWPKG